MGQLQNEDFKSEAELISASGSKTQLLNDTKIYISHAQVAETLDDAIETNKLHTLKEIASPSAPSATYRKLYTKSDGYLHYMGSDASEKEIVERTASQTLTGKTIAGGSNTISGLVHGTQVDNPTSGVHGVVGTVVGTSDTQTITGKTFDDPMIIKQQASATTPSANYNKLFPKSDNLWYSVNSSGVETPVGAGGGEYNFIATKQATDWAGYDDTGDAGYVAGWPVNGTGGTATGVTVVAATSPISNEAGVINIKFSKDAANRQGKGRSLDFTTRGDIDKAAIRVCKINVAPTANYVDGDVICMLYDTTNSRLIYPADQRIFASSLVSAQQFEFQLSSDSTAYRLILHIASTNASAYELNMVAKFVETKKQTGFSGTDWVQYTPTLSNSTNVSNIQTFWRKSGDTIEIKGQINWGGAGAGSTFAIGVPSGVVVDTAKFPGSSDNPFGYGTWDQSGTAFKDLQVTRGGLNPTTIIFIESGTTNAWDGSQAATGHYINFNAKFAVVGWSSNQVLSEDISLVRNIVEGSGNNSSALTSDVTDVNFTEVIDTAGCWDGSGFTADSTCTIMFSGLIRLTAASSASIVGYINGTTTSKLFGGFASTGGYFNGTINLTYGQRFSLRINENRTLSNVPSHVINIVKIANPQQIAASEKCYGYYTSSNGASLTTGTPATFVPLTKVVDSHNALSSGILTSPMSGVLTITASTYLACSGTSWVGTQGEYFELDLLVGASNKASTFNIPVSTTRDTDTLTITAIIPVVKGDLVKINVLQTSGVSGFTVGTSTNSWMSWTIQ